MHDPSAVRGTRSIPASTVFPRVRDPSMGGAGRAQLNMSNKVWMQKKSQNSGT